MANADQGFGVTITFSSGFLALVTNVEWSGIARDAIETTHSTSTSGYRTWIPSDLKDPGELAIDLLFDPDDSPLTPLTAAAATVTVTYPIPAGGSVAATWACSGFLTGFSVGIPIDDKMSAQATIKFTGVPTFTAGS